MNRRLCVIALSVVAFTMAGLLVSPGPASTGNSAPGGTEIAARYHQRSRTDRFYARSKARSPKTTAPRTAPTRSG